MLISLGSRNDRYNEVGVYLGRLVNIMCLKWHDPWWPVSKRKTIVIAFEVASCVVFVAGAVTVTPWAG